MFDKEVLNEILSIVKSESRVVNVLERRIEALEKREKELLDRIMARNYAEFVLGQDVVNEEVDTKIEIPEDALSENAGEMLETQ